MRVRLNSRTKTQMRWFPGNECLRPQTRRPLKVLFAAAASLVLLAGHAAADQQLGVNPIFSDAENDDVEAIRYLLSKDRSVDEENSAGETVLGIAAADGYLDLVELAINNGATIDHEDQYGKTALCWAAERGHPAVVKRLIKAHADINHQTREGLTPLMLAIRRDRAPVVRLLLRYKPDLTVLDYTGRGALGWARAGRDHRLATMLVQAGAAD